MPLTFVTPRSIFVGIRAELTLGALEAILANTCPIAIEAVHTLQAKTGPEGVRTMLHCKEVPNVFVSLPDFSEVRFYLTCLSELDMAHWDNL